MRALIGLVLQLFNVLFVLALTLGQMFLIDTHLTLVPFRRHIHGDCSQKAFRPRRTTFATVGYSQ